MANVALYQLTDVWTGGAFYNGISLDVTDTSSAAGSMLMTLKKDGLAKFGVRRDGTLILGDPTQNGFVIDPQGTAANTVGVFAKLDETDYLPIQVKNLRTGTLNALTASDPAIWANQTWNNGSVQFWGIQLNVTDTASTNTSMLMELKVNNVQAFSVFKGGWMSFGLAGSTRINFQPWDTEHANIYNDAVTEFGYFSMSRLDAKRNNAITASDPAITVAQTWNNSGVAFVGITGDFTSTASAYGSQLVDLKVSGTSQFKVRKDGTLTLGSSNTQGAGIYPSNNRVEIYKWSMLDYGGVMARDFYATWANARTTDLSSWRLEEGWDNAAVDFTAVKMTLTDTNSGAGSKLMDLRVNGASQFAISKTGALTGPGVREKLTADRTYYLNVSTGNDTTGDGSSGAPWQTLESALFQCARRFDLNGYTLKLELADGTYVGTTIGTDVSHPGFQGGGNVWIHGNDTNPQNVIINGSYFEALGVGSNNLSTIFASDLKLMSTSTNVVVVHSSVFLFGRPGGGGRVILGRSAASWAFLMYCYSGGRIQDNTATGIDIDVDTTTTPIAGIAAAYQGGVITLGFRSITGTPAWSNCGLWADSGGSIYVFAVNGSATGIKYKVNGSASIQASVPLTSLPGSIDGTLTIHTTANPNILEKLTADRTYYVRTDGNNANNGLADTSGGAWATLDYAINTFIAGTLDLNNRRITIQLNDGTHAGVSINKRLTNAGHTSGGIWIKGNHTTPANVIIDGASSTCALEIYNNNLQTARIFVSGAKLRSDYSTLVVSYGGKIFIGSPSFDGPCILDYCASFAYLCTVVGNEAQINWNAPDTTITGDTASKPMQGIGTATEGGILTLWNATFTNTPTFNAQGFNSSSFGIINNSGTYTGTAVGKKYHVQNGGIHVRTNGLSTSPGTTAGTWTSGIQNLVNPVNLTDTTASTSSTTGALTVAGGVGIAGELQLGGALTTNGIVKSTSGTYDFQNTANTDKLDIYVKAINSISAVPLTANIPGLVINQTWNNGAVDFRALRVDCTDTASGAGTRLLSLHLGGVAKAYFLKDGALNIASTTASSSTSTGSIVTAGGAGIAGDVYIGGTISVQGGTAMGKSTISTSDPTGGNDGDIWYKVI